MMIDEYINEMEKNARRLELGRCTESRTESPREQWDKHKESERDSLNTLRQEHHLKKAEFTAVRLDLEQQEIAPKKDSDRLRAIWESEWDALNGNANEGDTLRQELRAKEAELHSVRSKGKSLKEEGDGLKDKMQKMQREFECKMEEMEKAAILKKEHASARLDFENLKKEMNREFGEWKDQFDELKSLHNVGRHEMKTKEADLNSLRLQLQSQKEQWDKHKESEKDALNALKLELKVKEVALEFVRLDLEKQKIVLKKDSDRLETEHQKLEQLKLEFYQRKKSETESLKAVREELRANWAKQAELESARSKLKSERMMRGVVLKHHHEDSSGLTKDQAYNSKDENVDTSRRQTALISEHLEEMKSEMVSQVNPSGSDNDLEKHSTEHTEIIQENDDHEDVSTFRRQSRLMSRFLEEMKAELEIETVVNKDRKQPREMSPEATLNGVVDGIAPIKIRGSNLRLIGTVSHSERQKLLNTFTKIDSQSERHKQEQLDFSHFFDMIDAD